MTDVSTQDRRAFFEEHGWLVLRGVVSGARLEAMRRAFEAVMAPWLVAPPTSGEGGRQIWQLPGGGRQRPELLAHLHDGVAAVVADLLGAERIQLLQDTLIVKPPRVGARVELHQDYTYTGFLDPPLSVSVRLALTSEQVEDGCLYVVDGSHLWGVQGAFAPLTERLRAVVPDELPATLRSRLESNRRPLALDPGDVSVHHCLIFHGSSENDGEHTRQTIVTHVIDGRCRLVPERLPESARGFFASDADGHLVGDAFPVLFERGGT